MRPNRLIERSTRRLTIEISYATRVYNPSMATAPKPRPKGPWTPEEVARNERVAQARVARDRKRGPSANLEDGVALTRFANRFAEAFRNARRA